MNIRVLETALYVENLDRSEKFYRELFGFVKGGTTNGEEVPGGVIPPHDANGEIHLCFAVEKDDLDEWKRVLASRDVEIISTVYPPRGGTSIYFRDPDGHLIELATPGIWEIY